MSSEVVEIGPGLLSERAYRAIRELIVTLDLAPGSVVSEADLMAQLGIGRTPIREALRTLAREGLVEVYPRRGVFVAAVDARDLAALSEARAVLEPLAANLAAQRLTAADKLELERLLASLDTVEGSVQERDLIALDEQLHEFVYRCSRNPFLESALREWFSHALRIWFLALDRLPHLDEAVSEHRQILDAIRDGDGPRAAVAMSAHVSGFEAAIRQAL